MSEVLNEPRARHLAAIVVGMLAAVLLAACASEPPKSYLNGLEPDMIHDRDQAQLALERVAASREELAPQWRARERGCYRRFFVTACLDRLDAERREADYQFRRLEIRARFVLREADVKVRTLDEAQRLERTQTR